MTLAYQLDVSEVLRQLDARAEGLDTAEAERRLIANGYNELAQHKLDSWWTILWRQLTATMVVILLVAAIVSGFLGDVREAIAIFAIVIFNAALGLRQEYQAERAIAALKRLAVPTVRVRRDRQVAEISARELVRGDIVLLEAGNVVPADCRLLESFNLRTLEASLTGESQPVDKHARTLATTALPVGDRGNMAFMGTVVAYGRGVAAVTATGMATELGRIATAIQTTHRQLTPLQLRLEKLGKGLAVVILAIVAVIFGLGLGRGESVSDMFLTAVSLAVAAVPEGLPAMVTIALALGAQRMLERRALIRKLPAVETLGSVDVICSDKTGTLTENRMTVTSLSTITQQMDVTPQTRATVPQTRLVLKDAPDFALLLAGASLCNDAHLEPASDRSERAREVGDPTETALVVAATAWDLEKGELETWFPRIAELPFDSDRKRMTTVHALPPPDLNLSAAAMALEPWRLQVKDCQSVAFMKGAVDCAIEVCDRAWVEGCCLPLDSALRRKILADSDRLASEGIRVLGVAFRPLKKRAHEIDTDALERQFAFVGTVGTVDPARVEVQTAIQLCRSAGIRPLMITGDHPLTALHIARKLGLSEGDRVLTGMELDRLSDSELARQTEQVAVYARVSPQNKLDIVRS
ncbi:MAG: HAD-IC family P-type ATPase, partial [Cyanobacteria bacterium P01_F01_bin.33]